MNGIGIDVGSTYTKYCIVKNGKISTLSSEKTPIRQKEYFQDKKKTMLETYPQFSIVSCGYGKQNASMGKTINELTALAKGVHHLSPEFHVILDIGGQDTKLIVQENGMLKKFFLNDKCAAGSGMFLANTITLLEQRFEDIDLQNMYAPPFTLSSVCAIFAQTEIVHLVAENTPPESILQAVIWHILTQAKSLLSKVSLEHETLLLSGGLTMIPGFDQFASHALGTVCSSSKSSPFFSAIGCATMA